VISLLLAAAIWLLPGSGNVWTNGTYTWAGPQWCAEAGFLLPPDSPAIDYGIFIEGFHCPKPGPDPSGCAEWYGEAPDAGACERFPSPPAEPQNVTLE
jgi:hypothetical protein